MINEQAIAKWKTLRSELNVAQESELICSAADIEQAEQDLGFRFPAGYAEFCLVFGSGGLGQTEGDDFFRIYCPARLPSRFDICSTGYNLVGLKLDLQDAEPDENTQMQLAFRLLEDGYAFADTCNADSFFWDLASFDEADESYDIYWKPDEGAAEMRIIGRDFYGFVADFCLRDGWRIMFPDEDQPPASQPRQRFFTAFESSRQEESEQSDNAYIELLRQSAWQNLSRDPLFAELSTIVSLNCSYDAANRAQSECLQARWSGDRRARIEILEPSKRANIPRMVTVTVADKPTTRERVEELLEKMIEIGKACNCKLTGFGSEIGYE